MRVPSRAQNEVIVIDGGIRIPLAGIRGHQVRLGIEAPTQVGISREELSDPVRTLGELEEWPASVPPMSHFLRPGGNP